VDRRGPRRSRPGRLGRRLGRPIGRPRRMGGYGRPRGSPRGVRSRHAASPSLGRPCPSWGSATVSEGLIRDPGDCLGFARRDRGLPQPASSL
ncbi:MAG: hypothetical protein AVDCRST_MAG49-2351, partial [uncultured Thermomicrobiales bacterium]